MDYALRFTRCKSYAQPAPEPDRYAALLKAAYASIKSADPSATVISAGLSPFGAYPATSATRTNPVKFLEDLYAAGISGSFDALGTHPYNHPASPGSFHPSLAWAQLEQTTPSIRSLMVANGDADKKIWATEFGYPTCTTESLCVSEAQQSAYTASAIDRWGQHPWSGPLVLYEVEDADPLDTSLNRFGVFRKDGSEKPVAAAIRSRTAP